MIASARPSLDLTTTRIIAAPRSVVWNAWADRASFEQWWVPAPARCRVVEMDLRPGGAFVTEYSEDGEEFGPQLNGCFLAVDPEERIVWTEALTGGWRPSENAGLFCITAVISLREHPRGTEYSAYVMHRNDADRQRHEDLGFHDGWGTVADQLAALAESRV